MVNNQCAVGYVQVIKESIINKREYCSIKSAAQLLGCETEDIEHFLSIGAIGTYIYLFGHDSDSDVSLGSNLQFESSTSLARSIDTLLSTEMSYAEVKVIEGEPPLVSVQANLEGLWRVMDLSAILKLMHEKEVTNARLQSAIRDCENEFDIGIIPVDEDAAYAHGFTAPQISKNDVLIIGADLRRLHKALQNNDELPNTHNDAGFISRKNSRLEKKVQITRTSEQSRLRALGTLAYLFSQRVPGYMHGSKPNASKLSELIDKELSLLGVDKLSGEIRKDISAGYQLISEELPEKK